MNLSVTLAEIKALSIDDRICLVQAIWDSIEAEAEQLTLTEPQKQELSRRMADHKANPDAVVSWETVKTQAQARITR
jgi:putative addiction module component (TIGR02574 family)